MAIAMLVLVTAGCGAAADQTGSRPSVTSTPTSTSPAAVAQAHPQAVEPVAGDVGKRASAAPAGALHPSPGAPLAPASVTGAPAKGAPSDAEIRVALHRFQLAVARYHLDQLNLAGALLSPSQLPPGRYNVSIASVYTDYGLPIACGGVLHVPQLGVANKTLPCGTMVTFRYGGRAIRIPVIDRGPYIAGREWDLTGAAAEALHFPGLGPIEWKIG
ncbi:MAG: RlpA-like double-psi beta-barrel domain-containing protein [Solirubrobacteraceae bacterium]